MNLLKSLGGWSLAILTGVVQAEATANAESTGASKLKTATDIAVSEAQLMGQVVNEKYAPLVAGGANLAVATLNLVGLFSHKSTPATPAAPAAA